MRLHEIIEANETPGVSIEIQEIKSRIAELNTIILNCLNNNSVKSAATWVKAQRERETLKNLLCN